MLGIDLNLSRDIFLENIQGQFVFELDRFLVTIGEIDVADFVEEKIIDMSRHQNVISLGAKKMGEWRKQV